MGKEVQFRLPSSPLPTLAKFRAKSMELDTGPVSIYQRGLCHHKQPEGRLGQPAGEQAWRAWQGVDLEMATERQEVRE